MKFHKRGKRGVGYYPGSKTRPQESDPNYTENSGGGETSPAYAYAGVFTNTDTNQELDQSTYTDITGTAGDITPITEATKSYGIILNGKINTDAAAGEFEFAVVLDHDTNSVTPQTISLGVFKTGTQSKAWEPFGLAATFESEDAYNTAKLVYKRNSGSSTPGLQASRNFGVHIFEIADQKQLYEFVASSDLSISSSTWTSPTGYTTQTCDLTNGTEYGYVVGFQCDQLSGAPHVKARLNFGSGTQTIESYKAYQNIVGEEFIPFAGKFTASASHTSLDLQFQRSNGAGTYQIPANVKAFVQIFPISTASDSYANTFKFTKSGNQDIDTSSYEDIVYTESDPTVDLVSGANYAVKLIMETGTVFSGACDLQVQLNFNNDTETLVMDLQEMGTAEIEQFMIVNNFTPSTNLTNFKLQARLAFDGGLDCRLLGNDEYTVVIERVSD
jgi:hypothetical protein